MTSELKIEIRIENDENFVAGTRELGGMDDKFRSTIWNNWNRWFGHEWERKCTIVEMGPSALKEQITLVRGMGRRLHYSVDVHVLPSGYLCQ